MHLPRRHLHNKNFFICIINWLHLHLHVHAGANPCIASIKNWHMHFPERHLHHKKFLVTPSYGCIHVCIFYNDFCTRHSKNKHLHHMHIHSHLHPQEGHLHNKNKFFSFAPSYGCIHVCIFNKDFALDILKANIYITRTHIRICIRIKDICITRIKIFICTF